MKGIENSWQMGNIKQTLPVSNIWITHSATNLTYYPLIPGSTIIAHGAGLAPPMNLYNITLLSQSQDCIQIMWSLRTNQKSPVALKSIRVVRGDQGACR